MNCASPIDDLYNWPEVAIIGSYPPPYGGISVHLQRLAAYLAENGLDFRIYNTLSLSDMPESVYSVSRCSVYWYVKFLATNRSKVVHLVSVNWYARLLFAVAASLRSGKYVISIHGRSMSDALRSTNFVKAALTKWILRKMDFVISCNSDIERDCIEIGRMPITKIRTIPAFIPPSRVLVDGLPSYVKDYISCHSPVLSAVGWIGKTFNGCDVYGIDMIIELALRLRETWPQIGFVLCVNGGKENVVRQTVEQSRMVLGDNFLAITEPLAEFSPLAALSDIFVRPTNTDGDSVSIREALHVGTPVVASDAVSRPHGCIVFANRDIDDLCAKMQEALCGIKHLKAHVREQPCVNNAPAMLAVYHELISASKFQ